METYKDLLLGMLIGVIIAYLFLPKKVLIVGTDAEFMMQ